MKLATKALVPALALVGALALPPLAEAGHRHGRGCGHRGYSSGRYYDRERQHRARSYPYAHSYRYRPYRPDYYGYGYRPAPPPYGYGYGYGYDPGYYGYYPPPPYRVRPRVGVSLYLGF